MILRLSPAQIPHYWSLIKFGTLSVNRLIAEERVAKYCANLLKNLLSEEYQAWVGINEETKEINGVAITAIRKDIGDIPYLLLEAVYGFAASPLSDHDEFAAHMLQFGQNAECSSIMAYVSHPRIAMAAERLGMKKVSEVYRIAIGKEG